MDLSKINNQSDFFQSFNKETHSECINQYIKNVQIISTTNQHITERTAEEELIQLCDLLLGSFGSILSNSIPSRNRIGKRYLYKKSKTLIMDIEKKPYIQKYNLHKKLWVGHFPNKFGKMCIGRPKNHQMISTMKLDKWL